MANVYHMWTLCQALPFVLHRGDYCDSQSTEKKTVDRVYNTPGPIAGELAFESWLSDYKVLCS